MKYRLLIEKLILEKKKIVTRIDIANYCKRLNLKYSSVISYLLSNKYLVRIMRGIFYVKGVEERKMRRIDLSYLEAIREALKIKKVDMWYFGLETALKMNNLTHEYFVIDFILSDKIYRANAFTILGHKVKFLKVKKELLSFGIKKESVPYSDIEKTILDIAYFGKYNNLSDDSIKNKIAEYLPNCKKSKLKEYYKYYPKSIRTIIEESI